MKQILCSLTLFAAFAVAESSTSPSTPAASLANPSSTAVVAPPATSGVIAEVELRPQVSLDATKGGKVGSSDYASVGYRFTPDTALSYVQYFATDTVGIGSGLGAKLDDSYAKFAVNNIYDNGNGLSLSYQARAYLPAAQAKRDQGQLLAVRNYFVLSQKLNSTLTLNLYEIPILFANSQGSYDDKGIVSANPLFENRVYLELVANFTDKLSLTVPVLYYQTRLGSANGNPAVKSDMWTPTLYAYPEIAYAVDTHFTAGLAYMTGSWLSDRDSHLSIQTFADGWTKGTAQIILRATL